ncbi:MAG: bifunctional nuclease family protein [Muribaculaceae bacterium]|nr:bifunctional nuclease family protein [Muribaculaceae bacterium]
MTNTDLVELEVLGITRNAYSHNAYALLLKEKNGERIVPLVVGTTEAQAIAMRLEGVIPPRPITHDLFRSVLQAFRIMPERVEIYKFDNGVFFSRLHLSSEAVSTELDCRTSDAVAIALRTGAPIFAHEQIVEKAGYVAGDDGEPIRTADSHNDEELSIERLQERLQHYVDSEEYERAAEIQKIIASKMAKH